ncbi:MAG: 16S rRNA (adenine(1518)-N(6)/adenine(1519)-N(6))-dimethyltransferase RsmA [Chloroflexota bacterium]
MNTISPAPLNIQALLKRFGIRPSKGLGQNFLIDDSILQNIVTIAGVGRQDTVLEIGPGLGSLTRYLALVAGNVVAVELDQKLFPVLETTLQSFHNVHLIRGDILELELKNLVSDEGYLLVANIPYYITSAILRHILESTPKPRKIVLTVQKEIAERICAEKKLSLLAVSVQVYGRPSIELQIPAKAFFPSPQVDSAVVQIEISPTPLINPEQLEPFFDIVRAGFSQKRKTLRNSLSAGLHIPAAEAQQLLEFVEINPQRRAETLTINEWSKLTEYYLDRKIC